MAMVSVIMPIYNSAKYLDDALNSLSIQEFQDAEFICVDDGSTDDSLAICNRYAVDDPRFIVIKQNHDGPAKARNRGIARATGKYICFIDSDDILKNNSLQILVDKAESGDFDIVIHGAYVIDCQKNEIPEWISNSINTKNLKIEPFSKVDIFKIKGCTPFLWQHFIKSDLIKSNGLKIDENLTIGEDQAFEILYLSKAERVLSISDKLYGYRTFREGSIMDRYSNRLMDKMWQHIEMIKYVQGQISESLTSEEEVCFIRWVCDTMYWDIIKLLYYDQKPYADEISNILSKFNIDRHLSDMNHFDLLRV